MQQNHPKKKDMKELEFFTQYGDANRYKILEVIGKGSYGVVCAAIDTHTREKVAIKKIHNVFENISDAIRILREVKLLRLLRHPDIVEIKRIMLPPSKKDFKDIYVVFELMQSDLHHVIKANDDLTQGHLQFFLYQMLRALKYMHSANVYHRDLKPKNILANADSKLKVCDFGLARVAFSDEPTTIFWTDYVATRWYRAPELCGSFSSKYTPAIDIWSIGCIFAEVLRGKPLFPGKSVEHQLDLITDLLGTPSPEVITGVRNEKTKKFLMGMKKKPPVPFEQKFPNADPLALRLLQRLLAFNPKDRPTAQEALADPFFKGLAKIGREPCCKPISKLEFEFERRRLTREDVRELIYREILEYHPQMLKDYMTGTEGTNFLYPSAIDQFKKQFAYLEENHGRSGPVLPPERKHVSLPRSTVYSSTILPSMRPSLHPNENKHTPEEASKISGAAESNSGTQLRGSRPPPREPSLHPNENKQIPEEASKISGAAESNSGSQLRGSRPPPREQSIHPNENKQIPEEASKISGAAESNSGSQLRGSRPPPREPSLHPNENKQIPEEASKISGAAESNSGSQLRGSRRPPREPSLHPNENKQIPDEASKISGAEESNSGSQLRGSRPPPREPSLHPNENKPIPEEASKISGAAESNSGSQLRGSRPPPREPSAKPGRVVGPSPPHDKGRNIKDVYDSRIVYQNTLPQGVFPHSFHRVLPKTSSQAYNDVSLVKHQLPSQQCNLPTRIAAVDLNTNPYYQQGKNDHLNDPVTAIDVKLLQAQSQFGAVGAARRQPGSFQCGLS